jgi:hypothetical protein
MLIKSDRQEKSPGFMLHRNTCDDAAQHKELYMNIERARTIYGHAVSAKYIYFRM